MDILIRKSTNELNSVNLNFLASLTSLRSVVIVELYTMDHLSNAFGLKWIFDGFGMSMGIVIAAIARDYTKSYDISFYLSGSCLIFSGFLLIFVKKIRLREIKDGHF